MTIIKSILILSQVLLIIRFHLEISSVNAQIEPIKTIRKLTNPLVLPVKQLISVAGAKKFAAIVVAYLIAVVVLLIFTSQLGFFDILLHSLLWLIRSWLTFLQYGIFLYVIGSWIQIPVLQRVNYILHALFQPILRPIQGVIPSVGGIDFSPMVLLIGLSIMSNWFFSLFG